jgi:hypothetical protein
MSNITAKVRTQDSLRVSITSPNQPTVSSVGIGTNNIGLDSNSMSNVDTSSLTNGSVLVYKTTTSKWTSTTTLDAQNMEGGEF